MSEMYKILFLLLQWPNLAELYLQLSACRELQLQVSTDVHRTSATVIRNIIINNYTEIQTVASIVNF
jgi:hypothetical protein